MASSGNNGKYVSSEDGGHMTCNREHIEGWEKFVGAQTEAGHGGGGSDAIGKVYTLKASNGKYVSGNNGEFPVTADRDEAGDWEKFFVEDAGDGKVALKCAGRYLSSENGENVMYCNRDSVQDWERFEWINHGDGSFSLRGNNGKYVSSEDGGHMTCNRDSIQDWERFSKTALLG